jgi:hypothetical protein
MWKGRSGGRTGSVDGDTESDTPKQTGHPKPNIRVGRGGATALGTFLSTAKVTTTPGQVHVAE